MSVGFSPYQINIKNVALLRRLERTKMIDKLTINAIVDILQSIAIILLAINNVKKY